MHKRPHLNHKKTQRSLRKLRSQSYGRSDDRRCYRFPSTNVDDVFDDADDVVDVMLMLMLMMLLWVKM